MKIITDQLNEIFKEFNCHIIDYSFFVQYGEASIEVTLFMEETKDTVTIQYSNLKDFDELKQRTERCLCKLS